MFCRMCGNKVLEEAEICVKCGCKPLTGKNYCQYCGSRTNENQEICLNCGVRLKTITNNYSNLFNIGTESNSHTNLDFSYLSTYYQQEFQKIYDSNENYKGKFNWCAFLFGGIWALTKGIWLPTILWIIISLCTAGIGGFVFWIICGIRGNYWYYKRYVKNVQTVVF